MLSSSGLLGGCTKRLHLNRFRFYLRTIKPSSWAPDGEAAESSFKVIRGNILVYAECSLLAAEWEKKEKKKIQIFLL